MPDLPFNKSWPVRCGHWLLTTWISARGLCALVMLVIAGGRLGWWRGVALADALPTTTYAGLLLGCSLGLLVTMSWRYQRSGRLMAAAAAILMAGMAWDVGVWSNTALIEGCMAISLGFCAVSPPEC